MENSFSSTEEKSDNWEFNICTQGTVKPYLQQSDSENTLGGGCIYLQCIPGSGLSKQVVIKYWYSWTKADLFWCSFEINSFTIKKKIIYFKIKKSTYGHGSASNGRECMSWFLIGNLTEYLSAIYLAVSYWLQNKGQPSHRFTTSEQPQQRNGQRVDKAFKDVVITVPNPVTHNSYVLVKGKNHIRYIGFTD